MSQTTSKPPKRNDNLARHNWKEISTSGGIHEKHANDMFYGDIERQAQALVKQTHQHGTSLVQTQQVATLDQSKIMHPKGASPENTEKASNAILKTFLAGSQFE